MRFERMTWIPLVAGGSALLFGAACPIELAQAQPGVSVPNPPTQMFNPSPASTVPQPSPTPLAPTAPSVGPRYDITPPVIVPRPAARSYEGLHVVVTRAGWSPGYYDYASGQLGRGHPRYGGYWRPAGYHGD